MSGWAIFGLPRQATDAVGCAWSDTGNDKDGRVGGFATVSLRFIVVHPTKETADRYTLHQPKQVKDDRLVDELSIDERPKKAHRILDKHCF